MKFIIAVAVLVVARNVQIVKKWYFEFFVVVVVVCLFI